jgi:hypothetical protein
VNEKMNSTIEAFISGEEEKAHHAVHHEHGVAHGHEKGHVGEKEKVDEKVVSS